MINFAKLSKYIQFNLSVRKEKKIERTSQLDLGGFRNCRIADFNERFAKSNDTTFEDENLFRHVDHRFCP